MVNGKKENNLKEIRKVENNVKSLKKSYYLLNLKLSLMQALKVKNANNTALLVQKKEKQITKKEEELKNLEYNFVYNVVLGNIPLNILNNNFYASNLITKNIDKISNLIEENYSLPLNINNTNTKSLKR